MADTESSSYDGFLSYSHAADDLLAPRLQAGLQRFAKPWWKRRALRVFRDEASLSANPHLWSSITESLEGSGWFVLLLSPEAAQSEWVNREIDYWTEHKDSRRILPVVTDGEFHWADGDVAGNAVPPSLQGVFADEPRWVDLRFARSETQLDLRHAGFRDAIADVAAAIRGVPKDELESEEIHHHRRTIRTAWTAGVAILALGIAATIGAVNAQANANLARSRELAASAINVLDDDPELSVLLAVEAAQGAEPTFESVAALHEALQSHRNTRTIYWPEDWPMDPGLLSSISPDGRYIAVTGARHQLAVWDLEVGSIEPSWLFEVPWPDYAVITPYFTADSSKVVASVAWFNRDEATELWPDPPDEVGIYLLGVETGDVVRHIRGPHCPPLGLFQDGFFIDEKRPVGAGIPAKDDCSLDLTADLWLIDLATGEASPAHDQPVFTWNWGTPASISADGKRLSFANGASSSVVDADTGEVVLEKPGGWYSSLSRDGSRLLAASERTISLWDIDSGAEIWRIDSPLALNDPRFSEDESLLLAGAHDGMVRIWDASSGAPLHELKGHLSYSWFISMTVDRNTVASASGDGAIRIWDLSAAAEGEIAGFDIPGASVLQAGKVVDDHGAILRYPDAQSALAEPGTAVLFDVKSHDIKAEFSETYGGYLVRLSHDETLLAGQPFTGPGELGPVHIRRVGSGEVVTVLEDLCTYDLTALGPGADCSAKPGAKADQVYTIDFSPDGAMIAVGGADLGIVGVWEVATGERLTWLDVPPLLGADGAFVQFSPAGDVLIGATNDVIGFSVADWSELGRFPIDWAWFDAQFTNDGSLLVGSDSTRGEITTVDTNTWEQVGPSLAGHEGTVRDIDLNDDGSLIASAGSDGYVLIWDRESGELLQSIPVGSVVTLVDFINDDHLLVIPEGRPAMVMTIDVAELIELARSQVTRGFTDAECATYHFDPCPDLESIRNG